MKFFKFNRAFTAKKKFFSFLALSAIVLGMASCGDGNDPEVNNAPEGAINGKFTVDEGKQVYFSKGNLRAIFYGGSWTWEFAKNQWDFIGNRAGNTTINVYGTIAANDTVDLFGWSTDKVGNNFGISRSQENSVYAGDFKNWGTNIGNGWYTLSQDELRYLFFTRADAAKLFGLGKVNGIKGAILLPDDWKLPEGVPVFHPSAENGMKGDGWNYTNSAQEANNFEDNTYVGQDWYTMEKAGAVFLPAAGYRSGVEVKQSGEQGAYWLSTPSIHDGFAIFMGIFPHIFSANGSDFRYTGCAVRLVKEVE